jgi:hypothetical protein
LLPQYFSGLLLLIFFFTFLPNYLFSLVSPPFIIIQPIHIFLSKNKILKQKLGPNLIATIDSFKNWLPPPFQGKNLLLVAFTVKLFTDKRIQLHITISWTVAHY